ncbi:two-component system, NtrC family, sensor kinase [Thermotomaculum hydrothermale]|uniref:histidine kinase n=1 Tax=Thermotomaculum hydrothermale TaxID=981385 RepID=A0A7R6PYL9_9BACT|nr:ATP-binding protein [Thermotomaculum hydrothermale]BBB32023.1 two-component system, NtrC family, sensor kinase [Thermotomaculum hydrothermale]
MKEKIRTLRFKVMSIVAIALTTGFFIFAFLILSHQERVYYDYLKLNLNTISDTILKALEIDMMQNNREAIESTLKLIGHQDLIKELRIYSHKGNIYASINDNEKRKKLSLSEVQCAVCHSQSNKALTNIDKQDYLVFYKEKTTNPCTLKAIVPILNSPKCYSASCHAHSKNEKILGFLNIAVCTLKLHESLNKDRWIILLISAIFVFVLSYLIVFLLKRQITFPIRQLVQSTKAISVGDFNLDLPTEKKDEIGELAKAFEKMVKRIEEFKKELEGWNRELEKRVEEKTQKLKVAQKKILQAEKMSSLGRLAAVIAHEINNPISGLIVFINLLKKQIERGDLSERELERMYKNLALMESEAKRCGKIVSELLAFSKRESEIVPCDIVEIINRAVSLMQIKLKDSDIKIETEFAEKLPKVKCDPSKMQQVFINLIQNAADAMPLGGKITIKAEYNEKRKGVQVSLSDTGVGIPEEYLSHIFEPFFSSKDNGQSIGIGLFVVYGVIEQIGGKITVESEVGKGTTFNICIPTV